MAHKVKFTLPESELGKADIILSIHGDNGKIGTLTISKGAIEWAAKNWKSNKGYKTKKSWGEFNRLMSGEYKGRVGNKKK